MNNGRQRRKLNKKRKKRNDDSSRPLDLSYNGLLNMYRSTSKKTQKYIRWTAIWAIVVFGAIVISAFFGDMGPSSRTLNGPH